MENKSNILHELREISTLLAEADRQNVYAVSPRYFDNLPGEILSRINSDEERNYDFTSVVPYTVQQGYFENLPESILGRIKAVANQRSEISDELDEIAPTLNKINKTPLYTVPAGYFNELQPAAVNSRPPAKVFGLSTKMRGYLAAAVITGMMAIGSYLLVDKDLKPQKSSHANNVNTAIKDLKDDEIINFLKTRTSDNVTSTYSETRTPAREIKQQLKEMTDEELQQYLKENSELDEIEVDI